MAPTKSAAAEDPKTPAKSSKDVTIERLKAQLAAQTRRADQAEWAAKAAQAGPEPAPVQEWPSQWYAMQGSVMIDRAMASPAEVKKVADMTGLKWVDHPTQIPTS